MATGFRLNRRDVFLTYSRTTKRFSPHVVLRQLEDKAEIKHYVISQEQHKEAKKRNFHIHAYIEFPDKIDVKNERFFDLEYYGQIYHPNIQRPKKKWQLLEYIKKDNEYIENFESRPGWKVILDDSTTDEEFLTQIMWRVNRIDNYAGYKTLRDLWDLKRGKNFL